MHRGIIGNSGFVGSNLCNQTLFQEQFHSSNIQNIEGRAYDTLVCAAAPATKWQANQYPDNDLANIQKLISHIRTVKVNYFVLISTVDVYPVPEHVDEDTAIATTHTEPYGKHRYYLEECVRQTFPQHSIVRLPGLFGMGLKKNFIYDLIHNNCLHLTHRDSVFQFYNLDHLWNDIQLVIDNKLPLVNFATEPVRTQEVARHCFNLTFDNITERPPATYNMCSKYSGLFGSFTPYFYSAEETFSQIRHFVSKQAKASAR